MRHLKTVLFSLATGLASITFAGDIKPYDEASFKKLTASGRPVVIAVHAPWCNVCKAQGPIQTDLMKKPEYKDVTMLTVDFDSQKDALKKFKVSTQGTMVVFKNAKEVVRSVGDTNAASLEAAIHKAI